MKDIPRVAILITMVASVAVVAIFVGVIILTGNVAQLTTPAVLSVIGFVSLIITQLLVVMQTDKAQATVSQLKTSLDGHINSHSDTQAASMPTQPPPSTTGGKQP